MIGGDQFRAAVVEPFAAEFRNALSGLQHGLRRASAEAADYLGLNHAELAKQIRRACCDLVRFRQAIFGWAAFDDVADVNVRAAKAHRLDHLREKFSGAADERFALSVFVAARAFADKDELGFRIAYAEDDVRAGLVQLAAGAIRADVGANAVESVALDALFKQRWGCDRRNESGRGFGRRR